ncbi:hypothetical protein PIIN_11082 [Serendipita indica DSM 11827]|uniref:Uncharacterized protein n=1 Tax=Serendipita indica (strain DSM 11827) TaxID=1109443 RepID=G4U0K6_SERID|nr:hypothetical protein PIIN_11082 [Serendipita indica DSM 11827]
MKELSPTIKPVIEEYLLRYLNHLCMNPPSDDLPTSISRRPRLSFSCSLISPPRLDRDGNDRPPTEAQYRSAVPMARYQPSLA